MNIRETYDIILKGKYTYMAEQINNLNRKVTGDEVSNIEDQYDIIFQRFCELGFAICNLKAFIDKGDRTNEAKEREAIQGHIQRYDVDSVDDAIAAYGNIPAEFYGYICTYGEEEPLSYGVVVTSDECIEYDMCFTSDDYMNI